MRRLTDSINMVRDGQLSEEEQRSLRTDLSQFVAYVTTVQVGSVFMLTWAAHPIIMGEPISMLDVVAIAILAILAISGSVLKYAYFKFYTRRVVLKSENKLILSFMRNGEY